MISKRFCKKFFVAMVLMVLMTASVSALFVGGDNIIFNNSPLFQVEYDDTNETYDFAGNVSFDNYFNIGNMTMKEPSGTSNGWFNGSSSYIRSYPEGKTWIATGPNIIRAIDNTTKGEIHLPSGFYDPGASFTIPANITVIGEGQSTQINLTGNQHIRIIGPYGDWPGTSSKGWCGRLWNCKVQCDSSWNNLGAVIVDGTHDLSTCNYVLNDVMIANVQKTGTGLYLCSHANDTDRASIAHCSFGPIDIRNFDVGFQINSTDGVGGQGFTNGNYFEKVSFTYSRVGLNISASNSGSSSVNFFGGFFFQPNNGCEHAIILNNSDHNIFNAVITWDWTGEDGEAIQIRANSNENYFCGYMYNWTDVEETNYGNTFIDLRHDRIISGNLEASNPLPEVRIRDNNSDLINGKLAFYNKSGNRLGYFGYGTNAYMVFHNDAGDGYRFYVNGTTELYGKVQSNNHTYWGINNTTPSEELDVTGDAEITNDLSVGNDISATNDINVGDCLNVGDCDKITTSNDAVFTLGESAGYSKFELISYRSSQYGMNYIDVYSARGTEDSPTTLQTNDLMHTQRVYGHNGTAFSVLDDIPFAISIRVNSTSADYVGGKYVMSVCDSLDGSLEYIYYYADNSKTGGAYLDVDGTIHADASLDVSDERLKVFIDDLSDQDVKDFCQEINIGFFNWNDYEKADEEHGLLIGETTDKIGFATSAQDLYTIGVKYFGKQYASAFVDVGDENTTWSINVNALMYMYACYTQILSEELDNQQAFLVTLGYDLSVDYTE